jgi:hypothetical protein
MTSLDQVLDLLNKYHQRATYGAVAELAPLLGGQSGDRLADRVFERHDPSGDR